MPISNQDLNEANEDEYSSDVWLTRRICHMGSFQILKIMVTDYQHVESGRYIEFPYQVVRDFSGFDLNPLAVISNKGRKISFPFSPHLGLFWIVLYGEAIFLLMYTAPPFFLD